MGKLAASLSIIFAVFLVACAADSATDEATPILLKTATLNPIFAAMTRDAQSTPLASSTPAPTSCEEVEGECLMLSFDGKDCNYDGPAELRSGPVTLLFMNESPIQASADLWRHGADKTYQDMIDFAGSGGRVERPIWASKISGVWGKIEAGSNRAWEGVLNQGTYSLVCGSGSGATVGNLLGTGLMVEE